MFRGNHPTKVDEKGRLKVPAAFKQLLDAANVSQFYITSTDGECAEIWPLPEWEKRERALMESGTLDAAVNTYLNVTSYYGHQVEVDNQARVLLPQILRGNAKLDAEVTVFGKLDHLEVRNRETFEKNDPGKQLTPEKLQAVAERLKQHHGS
jgi:MraZ protein